MDSSSARECSSRYIYIFFFNDTATTEIYTLSLHDALPISHCRTSRNTRSRSRNTAFPGSRPGRRGTDTMHTSSRVVDKARELAAAGRHLEVVKYLGGRAGSGLAE